MKITLETLKDNRTELHNYKVRLQLVHNLQINPRCVLFYAKGSPSSSSKNRTNFQSVVTQSIIMGPYVLAGLTHDENEVAIDMDNLTAALSVPDTAGLVSVLTINNDRYMCGADGEKGFCKAEDVLNYAMDGRGYYLKMERDAIIARSDIATSADGMDATFRIVKVSSKYVG